MSRKRFLVVCRNPNDLMSLNKIERDQGATYIVASDDIRVHSECAKYVWIKKVCWIEKIESYYCVADDVIRILTIVNRWLKSLADDINRVPEDLLFWTQNCEGGMTTQRIQDLLLLIRSYRYLVETCEATKLIILVSACYQFEDDVLIATARSLGLTIQIAKRSRNPDKRNIASNIKKIAREPYYTYNVIKTGLKERLITGSGNGGDREIVFQLCSSELKHVAHTVPLMKALKKRGYNPVALCWRAARGAELVRNEGSRAEELEAYVPFATLISAPWSARKIWRKALQNKSAFEAISGLNYFSVELGSLLWPSIEYFFLSEISQRLRLKSAIIEYLRKHNPVAMRTWTTVLPEGVVMLHSLERQKKPLIFTNWWAAYYNFDPYNPTISGRDLELAYGAKHRDYLIRHGVPAENIEIVGKEASDSIDKFMQSHSKLESRKKLNIAETHTLHILFDFGVFLRGYLSFKEQMQTTVALLELAKYNPNIALLIKPHPTHEKGTLEEIIKRYSLPNVYLISKDLLPYHALNTVDVLITKCSTLGFEAVYFNVPIISVMLDRENNFRIFEDAATYVETTEELENLIISLTSEDYRTTWTADNLERQKVFVSREAPEKNSLSVDNAADAIVERLKRK